MNDKVTVVIIVVAILCVISVTSFLILNSNKENKTNLENDNNTVENNENQDNISNGKILVVYYSAQNHTEAVATKIANNLGADLFEIIPKDEYTLEDLNYNNSNSRVSKEHNDETLRNIELVSTKVDNWDNYDTVLIGYPIWWGVAAWPVDNFVKETDFTGKTVIPFCTSASSGLGQSGKLLESIAKGGNWKDGHRFSSGASNQDIKTWTDSLK